MFTTAIGSPSEIQISSLKTNYLFFGSLSGVALHIRGSKSFHQTYGILCSPPFILTLSVDISTHTGPFIVYAFAISGQRCGPTSNACVTHALDAHSLMLPTVHRRNSFTIFQSMPRSGCFSSTGIQPENTPASRGTNAI